MGMTKEELLSPRWKVIADYLPYTEEEYLKFK